MPHLSTNRTHDQEDSQASQDLLKFSVLANHVIVIIFVSSIGCCPHQHNLPFSSTMLFNRISTRFQKGDKRMEIEDASSVGDIWL